MNKMADTTTTTSPNYGKLKSEKSTLALSNLEHFYSRRRTASITMVAYSLQQSFMLGSSVVAGALLKLYTPGTTIDYPFFPVS